MVSLRIALRYLISKKKYHAVNIISLVSMAGVAVAALALVCVLSVFNGFSDMTYSQLSQLNPDLKVIPDKGTVIEQCDSLTEALSMIPGVAAAMPVIQEQALALYDQKQVPVTLTGVTDGYAATTGIRAMIIDGSFSTDNEYSEPAAVLSASVAMSLEAFPNSISPLTIYVPRRIGHYNPAIPMAAFRTDSFAISGVYESYYSDENEASVTVALEYARQLLDMPDQASSIYITLAPDADSDAVMTAIKQMTQGKYRVLDRLNQTDTSLKMISIEKWVTFLMLAFILLIASFNVISTLSMLIIEKNSDTHILRAMGATTQMLRRIFMWQGWLITVIGGIAGTLTGCLLCLAQQKWGFIKLNGDASQLAITSYPVRLDIADVALVIMLVAVLGWVISVITSRMALRK
ncbi:MAG: ABC transporter permease [Paramuribaculum sp.]|nr:ABC transporter permease [Paramuribaculum sp.]